MGFFDRLFGRNREAAPQPAAPIRFGSESAATITPGASVHSSTTTVSDEQALQRYRYMLQTAPPETIEQAHAEAFAQLTPAQRAQVLQALSAELPPYERTALKPEQDDPQTLARLATRVEMRQPGSIERALGATPSGAALHGGAGGMGMGGMIAGTILGALVAGFVGSMIAQQFFADMGDPFADAGLDAAVEEGFGGEFADFGADFGGDFGGDF